MFFTVVTVSIEVVLGFAFAMIMNGNYRGRGLVRASVLIPWAIPTAVTAKLWYFIFAYNGIANALLHTNIIWFSDKWAARSAIIIADVWKTTPFMALLILAGLQLISADIYEAAKVDGASAWQRFTAITLPLVKPALMVALLFRTLDVLRMYDLPHHPGGRRQRHHDPVDPGGGGDQIRVQQRSGPVHVDVHLRVPRRVRVHQVPGRQRCRVRRHRRGEKRK